jgi:hypothetical protein
MTPALRGLSTMPWVARLPDRSAPTPICSFGGVRALATHFDLHDVFAVQIEGEKVWRLYENRADRIRWVTPCRRTRSRPGSNAPAAAS